MKSKVTSLNYDQHGKNRNQNKQAPADDASESQATYHLSPTIFNNNLIVYINLKKFQFNVNLYINGYINVNMSVFCAFKKSF